MLPGTVPTAKLSDVGASDSDAFVIPFLPFEIEPFRLDPNHGSESNRGAYAVCAKNLSKRCKV